MQQQHQQQQQLKQLQQQNQLKNNFNQLLNPISPQQSNFPSFQSKPVVEPVVSMQPSKAAHLAQYSNNVSNNLAAMSNMNTPVNQGYFPSASIRQFPSGSSHLTRNISSYENFDPSKAIPMPGLTRNSVSASNNLYKSSEKNSFQNESNNFPGFSSINPIFDPNQPKNLHGMNFGAVNNEPNVSNHSAGLIKQPTVQPQRNPANNLSTPFFQSFNQQSRGY